MRVRSLKILKDCNPKPNFIILCTFKPKSRKMSLNPATHVRLFSIVNKKQWENQPDSWISRRKNTEKLLGVLLMNANEAKV